jgi:hypothetical protein
MKKVSIVVDVQHTYIKSQKKCAWSRNIEKFYKGMAGAYLSILTLTAASFRRFQNNPEFLSELDINLYYAISVLWHFLSLKQQFSSLGNRGA